MKTILAITLFLVSHTALASDFDQTCMNRYRDATISLINSAQDFNNEDSSAGMFLAQYSLIQSRLGATRLACSFESEEVKECNRLYKKQFHKVSDNVDMPSIAQGEQTHISTGMAQAGLVVVDLMCQQ